VTVSVVAVLEAGKIDDGGWDDSGVVDVSVNEDDVCPEGSEVAAVDGLLLGVEEVISCDDEDGDGDDTSIDEDTAEEDGVLEGVDETDDAKVLLAAKDDETVDST
jgi:hypothetical protein